MVTSVYIRSLIRVENWLFLIARMLFKILESELIIKMWESELFAYILLFIHFRKVPNWRREFISGAPGIERASTTFEKILVSMISLCVQSNYKKVVWELLLTNRYASSSPPYGSWEINIPIFLLPVCFYACLLSYLSPCMYAWMYYPPPPPIFVREIL